ncbi:hypothetical protein LO771_00295 [Streptacidiphilus sp. ASG 303]|uniref:hypothetical protein n=1 Tax=Streptacidiphilus sp. ASG 303 TaxID=2896847 RepID=UPI001E5195C9|nr:hypothetical protein [Streptacidiphilus sp. ASG 303]MCD0480892.1 hypothetical protein [Streptacidiphilus sp. ASG 303]
MADRAGDFRVGARHRAEVRRAYAYAARSPRLPFFRGAAAAYRWALGRGGSAPAGDALRAAAADPVALAAVLVAEERAAARRTADAAPWSDTEREYARGVHDALAWVCGDGGTGVQDPVGTAAA